jgi:type VI protein secretion system component Hcp
MFRTFLFVTGIALCAVFLASAPSEARSKGSKGHTDLTITKKQDKSSPKLMQSAPSGKAKRKLTPEKTEGGSENVRR